MVQKAVGSSPTDHPRKIAAWPVRIGAVCAKVLNPEDCVRILKTTGNCKTQGMNKVGIQRAEPGSTPDVRRQITIYFKKENIMERTSNSGYV